MRTNFVNCMCLAALAFDGVASIAEEEAVCANGRGAACNEEVVEESSLLQKSLGHQEAQRFPDFAGKINDMTKGMPGLDGLGDLAKKAQETMKEGQAVTLRTLGETINNTLKMLETEVDAYDRMVDENANDTVSGIASILARALNVPVDSVPTGPEFEMKANVTLAKAVSIWNMVQTRGQTGSNAMATGLETVGFKETAQSFNETVTEALAQGDTFAGSLRQFQALLAGESSQTSASLLQAQLQQPAAFAQFSIFGFHFGSKDLPAQLSETLQEAREQAQVFPHKFNNAFDTLTEEVVKMAQKHLSPEQVESVNAAFQSVGDQASALAEKMSDTTLKLLNNLDGGVVAIEASKSAAGGVAPCVVSTFLALFLSSSA